MLARRISRTSTSIPRLQIGTASFGSIHHLQMSRICSSGTFCRDPGPFSTAMYGRLMHGTHTITTLPGLFIN